MELERTSFNEESNAEWTEVYNTESKSWMKTLHWRVEWEADANNVNIVVAVLIERWMGSEVHSSTP